MPRSCTPGWRTACGCAPLPPRTATWRPPARTPSSPSRYARCADVLRTVSVVDRILCDVTQSLARHCHLLDATALYPMACMQVTLTSLVFPPCRCAVLVAAARAPSAPSTPAPAVRRPAAWPPRRAPICRQRHQRRPAAAAAMRTPWHRPPPPPHVVIAARAAAAPLLALPAAAWAASTLRQRPRPEAASARAHRPFWTRERLAGALTTAVASSCCWYHDVSCDAAGCAKKVLSFSVAFGANLQEPQL